ncbi:MAG: type II toxin-antitoxin system HipA family toxin [Bacteroidales bacterium]|nr:type II toxin-antitoxin system HipA family toxin [Bacteroidales bacterium]
MNGNAVRVVLWGETVGYLTWDSSNWRTTTAVFSFSKDFLDKGLDISPLMMSIGSNLVQSRQSIIGTNPKSRFGGLHPVFADSLPDHWGNSIFRKWAEDHKVSMKNVTGVDLLSFIGKRAMGALEYDPAYIIDEDDIFDVNVNELYAFAKSVLSERAELRFEANHELLWADLVKLGTSPGGKRPKALIAINEADGSIKSGQAVLPEGYRYYILKYDNESDMFPYARLEYAYYNMCCDAGIRIKHSELRRFENSSHFITERFDRTPEGKVHMQSLAALTGGATSYEEAFNVVRRLRLDYADKEQLFRMMVFNVLGGNIDDHDKNVSFLMDKQGRWSLAPAYDMVYSIDPNTLGIQKGQFMSIKGKVLDITEKDFLAIARENDINNPSGIISQVLDVVSNFRSYCEGVDVNRSTCDIMQKELNEKYKSFK